MEQNHQISDMRSFLFNQLEKLSDPTCNLEKEIKRAEAIVDVSRVIVESAKAETDFMKISGSKGSGFIPVSAIIPDQKKISDGNS